MQKYTFFDAHNCSIIICTDFYKFTCAYNQKSTVVCWSRNHPESPASSFRGADLLRCGLDAPSGGGPGPRRNGAGAILVKPWLRTPRCLKCSARHQNTKTCGLWLFAEILFGQFRPELESFEIKKQNLQGVG